ncbi:MAG TPA: glycosyltransferase, partial [Pyrinomonadaceae bacterium]|nr:glycosyltransferase [Pyrinomonadaceae bacterium]
FNFPTVEIIPHGVDTNIFFPLDGGAISERGRPFGRLEARRLIFPEAKDRDERFIVLNANRNQSRKRIDITIRGFALFAKGKPENVKLYLHMGVEDVGWNVLQLARRYGIENRLLLSSLSKEHPVASAEQLNLIYNACDVGINTSTAEGWGLVSFEHAATGAAQIVPRHSACQELWRDAAVMIEPAMALINEGISTEGWLVTPEGVAEALEKLYLDPQYLVEMSGKALRVAHRPEYRWETVSGQWDMLFQQTL